MSHQVLLPPLFDPATDVVVEHYYVDMNVPVVAGQAVALVRSDHFAWDIPATANGTLSTLVANVGSTVALGAPLIELTAQNTEHRTQGTEDKEQRIEHREPGKPEITNLEPGTWNPEPGTRNLELAPPTPRQVRATPVARRIAAAHGVNLAELSGTGRGNTITRADVLAALAAQGLGVGDQELGNTEQEFAEREIESVTIQSSTFQPSNVPTVQRPTFSVPHAFTAIEADLGTALATLAQHEHRLARRGITITTTACVAAAMVAALAEHPLLNSAWSDDGIMLRRRVNLLIEQPAAGGIHTTLIADAAELNLVGLARHLAQAHNGDQLFDDFHATFAIAQRSGPWWSYEPPNGTHPAQLTIGDVTQQPRVTETTNGDMVALRPVVLLVLAYDARVLDQTQADAFLGAVRQRLEHFASL